MENDNYIEGLGIKPITDTHAIWVICGSCKNEFTVDMPKGWTVNIIGAIQFRCPCGYVTNSCIIWGREGLDA